MSSSEDEYDPSGALDDLNMSLDQIEAVLEPLLNKSKTWDDLVEQEPSEMGKAKLGMMMAFGICDLIFVYLQMKGYDTTDHPVMAELKRVMTYNAKIKEMEANPKVRRKLDTAAAGRFISAAIPKSQRLSGIPTPVPSPKIEEQIGMGSRFKHILTETEDLSSV